MIYEQNEKYALDMRGSSFCIYDKDSGRVLCVGEIDKFSCHGDMVDHAMRKFKELEK